MTSMRELDVQAQAAIARRRALIEERRLAAEAILKPVLAGFNREFGTKLDIRHKTSSDRYDDYIPDARFDLVKKGLLGDTVLAQIRLNSVCGTFDMTKEDRNAGYGIRSFFSVKADNPDSVKTGFVNVRAAGFNFG